MLKFDPMLAMSLGIWEILVIVLVLLSMAAIVVGGIFLVIRFTARRAPATGGGALRAGSFAMNAMPPQRPASPGIGESGAGGTAPIPTEHCPKCGTAMAPGAAQGLCPRCLMGVGLGTQPAPEGPGEAGAASASAPPDPAELAPHFPQLEILEIIGQGGMGVVYRARQRKLDRVVALKVLSRGAAKDPAFAERFNREARTLARLNHPNIVTVYDFGEADGLFYLVMEYVDGADLRRVLQQGRLSPEEALRIVPVICDALQYAHGNGVVHRDIKPGNILMDREGRVKIADFGIAKLAGQSAADATLTQSKQSMGTLHYMAPEQVENPQSVDHRADIYSLGVVFYEMLTGELPLGRFAPPSRRVQVDVRLDEVVLRALEKEPDRRYQQAGDVKTEVERITVAGRNAGTRASREAGGSASVGGFPGIGRNVAGILWALMLVLMFLSVRRLRDPGGTGPSGFVWVLAYLGALAPLGTTLLGWLAYRDARRSGGNPRAVRAALWVMHALPTLGLAAVCAGLMVAFLMEVVGARGGSAAVAVTLGMLAILTGIGWLLHWWVRWWGRTTELKADERHVWFSWLPLGPVMVGLGCATFLIAAMNSLHARSRGGALTLQMEVANPGFPQYQPGPDVPLLGSPSSEFPGLPDPPAVWTMAVEGVAEAKDLEGHSANRLPSLPEDLRILTE